MTISWLLRDSEAQVQRHPPNSWTGKYRRLVDSIWVNGSSSPSEDSDALNDEDEDDDQQTGLSNPYPLEGRYKDEEDREKCGWVELCR